MPNQRAKNKIFFGGFIDRRFKARLKKADAKAGMRDNVFGFALAQVLGHPCSKRRSRPQLSRPTPGAQLRLRP